MCCIVTVNDRFYNRSMYSFNLFHILPQFVFLLLNTSSQYLLLSFLCLAGTCRAAFHPICARESKHQMEIWGKSGRSNVRPFALMVAINITAVLWLTSFVFFFLLPFAG